MYMELKSPETLREEELAHVTTPFYAVGQLKSAWHSPYRIRGFDAALAACTDRHHRHGDYQRHGFERLCTQVENGALVLVLDKSWEPISPAYHQVNGQWQVTRNIWDHSARDRLEYRLQAIQRQQREEKALQSQNRPSSAEPPSEPATGPGNRVASLGPHAGGADNDLEKKHPTQTSSTFESTDAAAKAALEKANPLSIQDNLEYGGLIYRDKTTGKYGYTGPIKGSDQGVNPFSAPVPAGCELVGDFHTHADYSVVDRNTGAAIRTSDPRKDDFNSDNFSSTDVKGIKSVGSGIPGYKGVSWYAKWCF